MKCREVVGRQDYSFREFRPAGNSKLPPAIFLLAMQQLLRRRRAFCQGFRRIEILSKDDAKCRKAAAIFWGPQSL